MPSSAEGSTFGSFSRKVETTANLATIVVAVLLSVVLIKTLVIPASSPRRALPTTNNVIKVGTNLRDRLAGVNWNRNSETLLFILSTGCHYCTESAPFFRQIRERAGKDVKLVGLLPQPTSEAESYLKGQGLRFDEIKQVSLERIGVAGTPTLLLLNHNGIVIDSWVGKLAADKQAEALRAILRAPSKEGR